MLQVEVLIVKLLAVDGLAAGAVADGEVTALDHELLDDAVELGALVVEGLSGLAQTLLAGAQGAEVLGRLGHDVVVQLHDDTAGLLGADLDVEEDAAARRLGVLGGGHVGGIVGEVELVGRKEGSGCLEVRFRSEGLFQVMRRWSVVGVAEWEGFTAGTSSVDGIGLRCKAKYQGSR